MGRWVPRSSKLLPRCLACGCVNMRWPVRARYVVVCVEITVQRKARGLAGCTSDLWWRARSANRACRSTCRGAGGHRGEKEVPPSSSCTPFTRPIAGLSGWARGARPSGPAQNRRARALSQRRLKTATRDIVSRCSFFLCAAAAHAGPSATAGRGRLRRGTSAGVSGASGVQHHR